MRILKKVLKIFAYLFLTLLVALCVYTFIMTDILKKDYANVFGYTYFVVSSGSMSDTIEVNDIIFVRITKKVAINDIVTYKSKKNEIITHRYIKKVGNKLILQGDANNTEDDPITKKDVIGKVTLIVSPSFILKTIAIFIILFIFLALINFDNIFKNWIVKGNTTKKTSPNDSKYNEDEKTGMTINIPIKEILKVQVEDEKNKEIEILDMTKNNIFEEAMNDNKNKEEKALLKQINNLLKEKNNTLKATKINKKWLLRYQFIFKIANILLFNDNKALEETIQHPSFKEIYNYDLDKCGLYENLRDKIYDMPIYIYLKILLCAVLYNDIEFFDGVYKIMKYKAQIDKYKDFKEIKRNDSHAIDQLKNLINLMKKIANIYDENKIFDLENIEKTVKLKSCIKD